MIHLIHLVEAHPLIAGIGAYWLFSAFVGGAPAPTEKSSAGYRWIYASLHLVAGNLQRAVDAKFGKQLGM